MKATIISQNSVFPWKANTQVDFSIKHLEDRMHECYINGVKYIFEYTDAFFIDNNQTIVKGFLTDNKSVGTIGFKFQYE